MYVSTSAKNTVAPTAEPHSKATTCTASAGIANNVGAKSAVKNSAAVTKKTPGASFARTVRHPRSEPHSKPTTCTASAGIANNVGAKSAVKNSAAVTKKTPGASFARTVRHPEMRSCGKRSANIKKPVVPAANNTWALTVMTAAHWCEKSP